MEGQRVSKSGDVDGKQPAGASAVPGRSRYVTLFRLGLVVLAIVVLHYGTGRLIDAYASQLTPKGTWMLNAAIVMLLLLYSVLLAIPFVPGVEIGIALLVAYGSEAAPFVYMGTLLGLSLSFGLGLAFSDRVSCKFLMTLGLTRACAFVDRMKELPTEERLHMLEENLPDWAGRWLLGHRYLLLALLLNLPGNSLIGGGGGIATIAGLSRMFTVPGFLVTIALATSPVPILVYFFGPGPIQ